MTRNFPKIIWQTHKWDYQDLPEIYQKTTKTWQVMNPDWEYRYIPNRDMRSYLEKFNSPELLNRFDDNYDHPMGQSDIWREVVIYEYGGIWADLDSACLFPIDRVIEKHEDKEMICMPPISKFCLELDEKNNYIPISTMQHLDKINNNEECTNWISNAVFLGKKHNKISKEIFESIVNKWTFQGHSFMDIRSELYEKYPSSMSLELVCAIHDGRINDRNYSL